MASGEAIRPVEVPTRTLLCFWAGHPYMQLRDTDLKYDTGHEIDIFAQGYATHKKFGIYPQVLALSPSPSQLIPRER